MSGDWPPEWEDLDYEVPEGADQLGSDAEARLSEVGAYLASLPAPALPEAVEARISAALAAEAAARAGDSGHADVPSPTWDAASGAAVPASGVRTLRPVAALARGRRRQSRSGGRRALRSRPLLAVGSVAAACLVLAGLGYALSRDGSPPDMPSAASAAGSAAQRFARARPGALGPASAPTSSAALSARPSLEPTAPASSTSPPPALASSTSPPPALASSAPAASAPALPAPAASAPAASAPVLSPDLTAPASPTTSASPTPGPSSTATVTFGVVASGTKYRSATLATQVQAELAASSVITSSAPSRALRGCVLRLTGGKSPRLVDRASYQGKPGYIIVGSAKVWVVAPGCTADKPKLITSVPLGT